MDLTIRCPTCRAFDWYRDGFAMFEDDDGTVARRRLTASADLTTPWSCAQCGYEVPDWSALDRQLREAQTDTRSRYRVHTPADVD